MKDFNFLIYKTEEEDVSVSAIINDDTVWLTQKGMCELFGVEKSTLSEHIKNVYESGELEENSTVRKFRTVQKEGNREVSRELTYYNLDTIISVGYRVNSKTTLKTYLFMLGRSRAIDYIRHRSILKTVELSDAESELTDCSELEDIVLAGERARVINEALKKLPEDMSAAVHLVYLEGMSYEEAARVMKKNKKQVDNLLYRAKAQLRSLIGKEGELLL